MPLTRRNLLQHELIGLEAEVARSSNPGLRGLRGRVVDETQRTLVLETPRGTRRVPKEAAHFAFTLPGGERVEVEGRRLLARPEDRVSLRMK
ncbi:MAG: ribonuclease P protein subunit [Euryarchaeota archaeon]|nr:ribonuclease P protein subunit [Euryarchaeota archaeon]